jgi:hypothetical protein
VPARTALFLALLVVARATNTAETAAFGRREGVRTSLSPDGVVLVQPHVCRPGRKPVLGKHTWRRKASRHVAVGRGDFAGASLPLFHCVRGVIDPFDMQHDCEAMPLLLDWSVDVRKTGSVIDVGAGAGRCALHVAAAGHRVVATEGDGAAFDVLKMNVHVNDRMRALVKPMPAQVGAQGTASIAACRGASACRKFTAATEVQSVTVPTLRHLFAPWFNPLPHQKIQRSAYLTDADRTSREQLALERAQEARTGVDLLKINEGVNALHVLAGADAMLRRKQVGVVQIELSSSDASHDGARVVDRLAKSYGYRVFQMLAAKPRGAEGRRQVFRLVPICSSKQVRGILAKQSRAVLVAANPQNVRFQHRFPAALSAASTCRGKAVRAFEADLRIRERNARAWERKVMRFKLFHQRLRQRRRRLIGGATDHTA